MGLAFPEVDERVEVSEEVSPDTPWQVVVSNDPVNLIDVVCVVFIKVLGLTEEVAMDYTMKVHNEGRCAVYWGSQEECTQKAEILMSYQLWTHIEKSGN